jgi:DNA-binding beta-propeller fold protein YncE
MKTINILTVIGLCLLFQLTGCKKEDGKNLYLSQSRVVFDYSLDLATITISNTGSKDFTWTASTPSDFLEFSKSTGTCSKNSPDKFDIRLLRERIHTDSITTSVTITTSSGETASISLFIHGYPESKIRYNPTLLDAGYDYIHDRLILLAYSGSDYFLDSYDLAGKKFTRIPLAGNSSPSNLSVSPDGTYAVVGSGSLSKMVHIDLMQNSIINTFPVEQFSGKPITRADKQVFYFPYYEEYSINRLTLTTGSFASFNVGTYLYVNMAELHPSGKYIYAAGYSQLFKFNVSTAEPQLVYSTSSYYMNSKLWLSADGLKIFTMDKKILSIDPQLPGNDVTQVSEFQMWQNYVYLIRQNPVYNEYCIVPSNSSYSYDANCDQIIEFNSNFEQVKTVLLEKYYFPVNNGQSYQVSDAIADYMFVSSDGNKMVVISHAENNYYSISRGIEIISR